MADPEALRVLDITKFYAPGGGGVRTYLEAKISDFQHRRVRHTLVIPGPRPDRETRGRTTVYRIPGPPIPFTPGYRFLHSAPALREIIHRERPQVIEVGSPFLVPLVTRWASQGHQVAGVGFYHTDLIRTYLDPYLKALPKGIGDAARRNVSSYVRRVYSGFDATVAASPAVARELSALGIENVQVIPLGVGLTLFHPDRRSGALRDRLRVPPDTPIALFAGRLCPEKELGVVVEAHGRMAPGRRPHLLFVGEGPSAGFYRKLARNRGDFTVMPFVIDRFELARIYASADLYLAAGPGETFGLAVAEAMAAGNPVVGVDSGAVPDRIRGSGAGELYENGNPSSAADAMARMMGRLGPGLRASARSHAVREFAWGRSFDLLWNLYAALAESRG